MFFQLAKGRRSRVETSRFSRKNKRFEEIQRFHELFWSSEIQTIYGRSVPNREALRI